MKNKKEIQDELELIEKLLGAVNEKEEYDFLIAEQRCFQRFLAFLDNVYIIERRLI